MPESEEHSPKLGRPTKKTPARCKLLFAAIEEGLPFVVACQSAGVSYERFNFWRRTDPRFAQAVVLAEAKAIQENLKYIKDARAENWPAAAWSERGALAHYIEDLIKADLDPSHT